MLAMKIGKRATLAEMDARGWAAFASDAGLGLTLVRRRIAELCESVTAAARDVAGELAQPGLDEAALARFAELVRDRAGRCGLTVRD
jgi:serine/threonine-protein kinase HipA